MQQRGLNIIEPLVAWYRLPPDLQSRWLALTRLIKPAESGHALCDRMPVPLAPKTCGSGGAKDQGIFGPPLPQLLANAHAIDQQYDKRVAVDAVSNASYRIGCSMALGAYQQPFNGMLAGKRFTG